MIAASRGLPSGKSAGCGWMRTCDPHVQRPQCWPSNHRQPRSTYRDVHSSSTNYRSNIFSALLGNLMMGWSYQVGFVGWDCKPSTLPISSHLRYLATTEYSYSDGDLTVRCFFIVLTSRAHIGGMTPPWVPRQRNAVIWLRCPNPIRMSDR